MDLQKLSALILPATLFLAPGLRAGDAPFPGLAPPAQGNHELTSKEQELLKQLDINGYGKLDEEELAKAHEAMRQQREVGQGVQVAQIYKRLLDAFDKDHKGSLNADEQAEAVAYIREHKPVIYQNILKRFDLNGDGKLDAQEISALFTALARIPARAAPPPAQKQPSVPGSIR